MTLVSWFTVGCLYCILDVAIDHIIFKRKTSPELKKFIKEQPIIVLIAICCMIMCWPIFLLRMINKIFERMSG